MFLFSQILIHSTEIQCILHVVGVFSEYCVHIKLIHLLSLYLSPLPILEQFTILVPNMHPSKSMIERVKLNAILVLKYLDYNLMHYCFKQFKSYVPHLDGISKSAISCNQCQPKCIKASNFWACCFWFMSIQHRQQYHQVSPMQMPY